MLIWRPLVFNCKSQALERENAHLNSKNLRLENQKLKSEG